MNFNSRFKFKSSKRIGVFGCDIRGMTGYDEWKAEKSQKCTNIEKVK